MTGVPRVATIRRDCQCPLARHEHGTPEGYSMCGCKCLACRVAYDARARERRAGIPATPRESFVPTIGTARRLEALHALGWTLPQLEAASGIRVSHLHSLRTKRKHERIYPGTAERIARLYDALSMTRPQPWDWTNDRMRRHAERNGWHPPIAWDDDTIDDPDAQPYAGAPVELDEIAVERYVAGTLKHREFQRYSPELIEAVRILAGRRLTDAQIGERVGVHQRRIQWLRAEHGIPAGVAA